MDSLNQPNPRHVEILLSMGIKPHTQHHNYAYIYNSALTAMQRAVEEALKEKQTEQCEGFKKGGISDVTFVVRSPDYIQQLESKVNELESKLRSIEINQNQTHDTNPY